MQKSTDMTVQTARNNTVLQDLLNIKILPNNELQNKLNIQRSTLGKWKSGKWYPNRQNAKELIRIFRDLGIIIDYNSIYGDINYTDEEL
ncbi:hypothetical protein CI610_01362 [invertebrate metagenome]|uniref:HTH cro/C1-type domain-containing protein n=1 Tax=invertebrate metagenome TaxID=1711999 RepID=A0A2H9T935_9ZZZZ